MRGRGLPDGEPLDLYADGDRWTTDPVAGAELVAEGWLLPGLSTRTPTRVSPIPASRSMSSCCARTCAVTSPPA